MKSRELSQSPENNPLPQTKKDNPRFPRNLISPSSHANQDDIRATSHPRKFNIPGQLSASAEEARGPFSPTHRPRRERKDLITAARWKSRAASRRLGGWFLKLGLLPPLRASDKKSRVALSSALLLSFFLLAGKAAAEPAKWENVRGASRYGLALLFPAGLLPLLLLLRNAKMSPNLGDRECLSRGEWGFRGWRRDRWVPRAIL